jgi:hypothetical protein
VAEVEAGGRLDAGDYRRLREAVGWGTPALDEGALYAKIWDMIVLPEEQRRGGGRGMIRRPARETP